MSDVKRCWDDLCIASDCGPTSLKHVDNTGYTWEYRREDVAAGDIEVFDLILTEGVICQVFKIEGNAQLPGLVQFHASGLVGRTLNGYETFRRWETVTRIVEV